MPEDRPRTKHPEVVQERDWRLAVDGQHALELHHILGRMDLEQDAQALGCCPRGLEQLRRAGVGLGRAEHAPDPAAVGRQWSEQMRRGTDHAMAVRDAMPADRFLDVRFEDTVRDPFGVAQAVYRFAVDWWCSSSPSPRYSSSA